MKQCILTYTSLQIQIIHKPTNPNPSGKLSFATTISEAELTHAACEPRKAEILPQEVFSQEQTDISLYPILQPYDKMSPTLRQWEEYQQVGSTCEQFTEMSINIE